MSDHFVAAKSPLIIDIASFELDSVEREKLAHPVVGGLILFSRNYADIKQLDALISDIRRTVNRPFLIAVDHEGGRVQRFREGFTHIPSMADIENIYPEQHSKQNALAKSMGFVMAYELLRRDIDISFAPVLDINGVSEVIGSRAFSSSHVETARMASYFSSGMQLAGMKATGKHFPGHGSVREDSHIDMPVDDRSFEEIEAVDLSVFKKIIEQERIQAIMPAHVIYSQVDDKPAGFSQRWIQQVLKQQLGFKGVVFSDDLSMQAASAAGSVCDRADQALAAGCDMILVCNSPNEAESVIDHLGPEYYVHTNTAVIRSGDVSSWQTKHPIWHKLLITESTKQSLLSKVNKTSYDEAARDVAIARELLG